MKDRHIIIMGVLTLIGVALSIKFMPYRYHEIANRNFYFVAIEMIIWPLLVLSPLYLVFKRKEINVFKQMKTPEASTFDRKSELIILSLAYVESIFISAIMAGVFYYG